jgi:hypothetical protein
MGKKNILSIVIFVLACIAVGTMLFLNRSKIQKNTGEGTFSEEGILEETGKMQESKSAFWWLNSGGVMTMDNNLAKTNFGGLPEGSKWQKKYAKTNSRDTDGGYYPQNIFRLVTRNKWEDLTQQLYFNIDAINLSDSSYRDASNGVLLFNRYQDGDNLYYTGLRVDGHAVIKKKIKGKYYTMAEKKIFAPDDGYDKTDNPNMLPLHTWIGIKSEVRNAGDVVDIKLYIDKGQKGDWQLVLEMQDKGDKYGKAPFLDEGYAGIRTDFMDVQFKNFAIQEQNN